MEAAVIQTLARVQRRVFNALAAGGKMSAADISIKTLCSDPRGHIRDLREKGVNIADEWRITDYGNRYKVYWLAD